METVANLVIQAKQRFDVLAIFEHRRSEQISFLIDCLEDVLDLLSDSQKQKK